MKRLINLSVVLLVLSIFTSSIFAQEEVNIQNKRMVKAQTQQGLNTQGPNWTDADGDGICDNFGTSSREQSNGKGHGLKDGNGAGTRPQDGTGFGKGNRTGLGDGTGAGVCDGSGPKGGGKRSGRR